nr:ORF1 [Lily amalgavirus 1]
MRENVHKMFLSVAQYLKAVKNLTSITDVKMLSMVFQAAVKADAAPLPNLCTEKSIYLLAKWIKKGPGARALALAQHSIKIDKKTAPGFSSAETSYAILLEQQIQDLIANRKEIRTRHEEEILRLQRRIDGIRRQIETDIRRGDRAFVPANNYAPLDKAELSAECWARFVAELAEFKKPIPAWSSILQPVAEEKFAAQVQREHKAMFCRGPGIMESLRKWADSKILQLRAENSFREIARLSRLLGGLGGEEDVEDSAASEGSMGGPDSDRASSDKEDEEPKPNSEGTPPPEPVQPEVPSGEQERSTSGKRTRIKKRLRPRPAREPKNPSAKKVPKVKKSRNSDRAK